MSPQTVTGHFYGSVLVYLEYCRSSYGVWTAYHWLDIRFVLQNLSSLDQLLSAITALPLAGILFGSVRYTLSQSLCTSFSASCLQFIKLSIHPSSVGIEAGSVAGDNRCGSGSFPISTSIFVSILARGCENCMGEFKESRGQQGRKDVEKVA